MSLPDLLTWPYVVITVAVLIFLLYIARNPAHQAILAISRIFYNAMRLSARSVMSAESKLQQRNREVLLASGMNAIEKKLEREFYRVNSVVQRDLQGYPALHRSMSDLITRIDEDYRESTESPPSPPAWLDAIEAVSKIPSSEESLVGNMLKEIHKTLKSHHKETMDQYRKSSGIRHSLLKKMMPFWRKLTNTVDDVGKTISGLMQRAEVIDKKMLEYEEIRKGSDRAVRILSSSSMTHFFTSGFVLLIAFGGAVVNFNLIALPMSEMVGGGSYIGSFKASNIAAMVIILLETVAGIFLMESLRFTNMFPLIQTMDDKWRKRLIIWTFTGLLAFACIEAGLAFMRDLIAADIQSLRQSLAGVQEQESSYRWITTAAQMGLGFLLPFMIALVAIPLESFVESSRTILGVVTVSALRGFAFVLRLAGHVSKYIGQGLIGIYDLLIFPPLWIERLSGNKAKGPKVTEKEEVQP
ncbi:MAG: hypothetical protein JSV21_04785 [Nitrospirota bacterium]|nr:MAG: hypothetical protein JSV21_04785 [Nitrospirota bacterium]